MWLGTFGPRRGGSPAAPFFSGVAVGDLNGDRLPDVASTHTMLNSVPPHAGDAVVYLQNEDGSFAQGVRYSAGSDPVQIRIADLNGDGVPDLVTVHAILNANDKLGNSTVSVLLQQSTGEGRFLGMKQYPIGRYPNSIAVGDLDGDRRNDIAVATATAFRSFIRTQRALSAPRSPCPSVEVLLE